jgi:putative transposase
MSGYIWRRLTPTQREEVLAWRKDNERPWHAPPHRPNYGHVHFLISVACYEHAPYIGYSLQRMDTFANALLDVFREHATRTVAWCVLPNHYHALVAAPNVLKLLYAFGRSNRYEIMERSGTTRKCNNRF